MSIPGRKQVGVWLKSSDIDYMMADMLPDGMRRSIGGLAASILERAIADHRAACAHIRAPLNKTRLMAGR